ncbi:unnamed protein product, partial [Amoebophrya sp. A120]
EPEDVFEGEAQQDADLGGAASDQEQNLFEADENAHEPGLRKVDFEQTDIEMRDVVEQEEADVVVCDEAALQLPAGGGPAQETKFESFAGSEVLISDVFTTTTPAEYSGDEMRAWRRCLDLFS